MKKATGFIALVLMLTLCGCTAVTTPKSADLPTSQVEMTAKTEFESEIEPASFSAGEKTSENEKTTESKVATTVTEPKTIEKEQIPSPAEKPIIKMPVTEERPKETETPKPPTATTERPASTPVTTVTDSKPAQSVSTPKPTESAETKPTTPPTEQEKPLAPKFEIDYWIAYAQSYAQSVGLRLEGSAVDCWDNPISAGANCIYLERDIKSRLNYYNRDEDITDVWIWAEQRSDGNYDLYIGYA